MKMCSFPGCQRLDGHIPSIPHATWDVETLTWVPLADQRTRAEQMRDRRNRINREKAERIAEDTLLKTFAGRQASGGGSISLSDVREIATAAALAGLTEGTPG